MSNEFGTATAAKRAEDEYYEQRARAFVAAQYGDDPTRAQLIFHGKTTSVDLRRGIAAVAAALRSSEHPPTPEDFSVVRQPSAPEPAGAGYVLVPRDPTPEMLEAAGTIDGYDGDNADADHINWWHVMVEAAPPAPRSDDAPRERGISEQMDIVLDLVHASNVDFYTDEQASFLRSIAERVERLAPQQREGASESIPLSSLLALLPGPYYMDLPDGGDTPVLEQLRRMAADATRWRLKAESAPRRPVTDEIDIEYPPLPRCWSGSPVTVTWAEDGEQTTREVYSSDQMHEYALKAVESFRSRLAGESAA